MNVDKLFTKFLKDFKTTEDYKNLSPAEKSEIDNVLNNAVDVIASRKQPDSKRSSKKLSDTVLYQLKVSLKGARPPIWRRILVPGNITFHQLHDIIQIAMGWENYHLYSFEINDVLIEIPEEEKFGFFLPKMRKTADSRQEKLADLLIEENVKITYTYDFGDDWEHTITLEKLEQAEEKLKHPVCLKGKRACPPEDSGGIYGYLSIVEVLKKNKEKNTAIENDDYEEELLEFYGDFDPEAFDLDAINKSLEKIKLK